MICPAELAQELSALRAAKVGDHAKHGILLESRWLPLIQFHRGEQAEMTEESGIVVHLKKEHERLTREIRGVGAALTAFGAAYGNGASSPKISAAARGRMAAAQKARWAKVRNNAGQKQALATAPKRRTMSVSARKKIAAAQKLRWAKFKAAKKKSA